MSLTDMAEKALTARAEACGQLPALNELSVYGHSKLLA